MGHNDCTLRVHHILNRLVELTTTTMSDNSEPLVKGYRTMPWSRGRVSPHDGADWLHHYQGKFPPSTGVKPPAWYRRLWFAIIKTMDHNKMRKF
jgi:hypothetical protein